MRGLTTALAILLLPAAVGIACSGGGSGGPGGGAVLSTLEVTPPTAALFSLAPGNTVQLAVVAKDQDGDTMGGVDISFSSQNDAVATVAADGQVTAAGAGTTEITASATFDGVTLEEGASVTVQVAPAAATVTAPQLLFTPEDVDVSAGGSVTWSISAVPHSVNFTTAGAPTDIGEMESESQARVFASSGVYSYFCDIHPSMQGTVRVH